MLERVDHVQRRLPRELSLTELEALRGYNLAPLSSRRDIGMLGALHKLPLGTAPPQLGLLLPVLGHVLVNQGGDKAYEGGGRSTTSKSRRRAASGRRT